MLTCKLCTILIKIKIILKNLNKHRHNIQIIHNVWAKKKYDIKWINKTNTETEYKHVQLLLFSKNKITDFIKWNKCRIYFSQKSR